MVIVCGAGSDANSFLGEVGAGISLAATKTGGTLKLEWEMTSASVDFKVK